MKPVFELVVSKRSSIIRVDSVMCTVTKKQPVADGLCSKKRLDGSVDFYRGWDDYKRGFGNLNGEFWLGLDKIHRLTKGHSRLWVDLEDFDNQTASAEYDSFGVGYEQSKYKLERLGQCAGKTQQHS